MYQCIRPLDLIIMIFSLENYDFGSKFLHGYMYSVCMCVCVCVFVLVCA